MKNMTLEHIAAVCGGTYIGNEADKTREIQGAVIDSRLVENSRPSTYSSMMRLSSHLNASSKALLNSSSVRTIVTPILEPPQHGFTTHGSFKPSSFAESFRFSFFMENTLWCRDSTSDK